jgi:hypothetical protein
MKWKLSLLFLPLLLSSCCLTKKTVTRTITEIQVDTVIQVRTDTFTVIRVMPDTIFLSGDTLKVENRTSVARAFYNMKTQKVELKLTGKIFEVPVKIQAHVIEKKKETEKKTPLYIYIFGALIGLFIYAYLTRKK